MASSDFLTFATGSGANVVSQSTYASMAALGPGFQTGIAQSNQLNKVWRQGSIMAAVIGQLITNVLGQNVVDDGTTATILGNLLTTIMKADYVIDTGVANAYTLTFSPALIIPLTDGASFTFQATNANTGASTASVNGSPAKAIVGADHAALTGGEIIAGGIVCLRYNAALGKFVILVNTGGIERAATVPGSTDNSTKVATTAFVQAAIGAAGGAVVASSIATSGYIKFGNGLIIQWAAPGSVAGGPTTFSFPLAFPAACWAITMGSGIDSYWSVTISSATQYAINLRFSDSSAATGTCYIVAFGH